MKHPIIFTVYKILANLAAALLQTAEELQTDSC